MLVFLYQQVPELINFNWLPEMSNEWGPGRERSGTASRAFTINHKTRGIYELVVNCQHNATKWVSALIINKEGS